MLTLKNRAERVVKLLTLTKTDACVVKSRGNCRYFTGINFEDGMVVVTKKGNRYVIVDERYEEYANKKLSGGGFIVKTAFKPEDYMEIMNEIVQSDRVSAMLLESDSISHEEYTAFENAMYSKVMPLKTQLAKIRACKDLAEVECIKTAQRISEKTFEEVLEYIKPGMSEKQLEAKIVQSLLENGSEMGDFKVYCVSGAHSSFIHGTASEKIIEKGDCIMMDFGAIYGGYRSVMARTVCVGNPSDEFVKAYNVVKNATMLGAKYIKSDISGKTADEEIRGYIEQMGYGKYFRHASGHGVGIDYAELPYLSPRSTDVQKQGNVIVVEPGIYIKGRFGIRIGDLFYIGEKGTEDLTRAEKELIIL